MTKTLQSTREQSYIERVSTVSGLLAILFMMVLLLGGCASLPSESAYDGAVGGALGPPALPSCTDICWLMAARNDNYYEARVYINGHRVARLPGMMAKSVGIPIRKSMLDAAGCMEVYVQLFPDTKAAHSSTQCPAPGSQLELAINESYGEHPLRLALQDWRR
jgi:hypothetical protein